MSAGLRAVGASAAMVHVGANVDNSECVELVVSARGGRWCINVHLDELADLQEAMGAVLSALRKSRRP